MTNSLRKVERMLGVQKKSPVHTICNETRATLLCGYSYLDRTSKRTLFVTGKAADLTCKNCIRIARARKLVPNGLWLNKK